MTMKLPPDGATSGKVILSASRVVEQLLQRHKPMKFMFGLTHDPVFRYHNSRFGYKFGRNSFRNMVVLYSASDAVGPAFLEATLIDKYGGFLSVAPAFFELWFGFYTNLRSEFYSYLCIVWWRLLLNM